MLSRTGLRVLQKKQRIRASSANPVAVLFCVLGNCGPGTLAPVPEADPLAVVRVSIDLSDLPTSDVPENLRIGIAWGASWENPAICHLAQESPVVQSACRPPHTFVLHRITPLATLARDEDGTYALPISTVPPEHVTVGTPDAWLAYGNVVAVLPRSGWGELGAEDVRRWRYLAASVVAIDEPHTRLVVRQGPFDAQTPFYPYPVQSCGPPPLGFSMLNVTQVDDSLTSGTCTFSARREEHVVLKALSRSEDASFSCPPPSDAHHVWQPASDVPTDSGTSACLLDNDVFVTRLGDPYGVGPYCPILEVWALKGCERNLACDEPDWDLRAEPPASWPWCTAR